MKNLIGIPAGLFFSCLLIISCKDKEPKYKITEKWYTLYCWPSKTACENREYGIEFSYRKIVIAIGNPQPSYPRVATLICCRYIEDLVDSLTAFNDSLKNHRDNRLGNFERHCTIGTDIEVHVNYSVSFSGTKPFTFTTLGFKDRANPYDFDLDVPQFEYFDEFKNEVMELYRRCCLRERDN